MRINVVAGLIFGLIAHVGLAYAVQDDTVLSRRDKVFAVYPLSNKVGWAVGNKGLVIKTSDGGDTWEQLDRMTNLSLHDVFFANKHGWIVGQDGLILETKDGGNTWKEGARITAASLMKLFFIDENNGFIVGEMGTIFRTVNGGQTWESFSIDWMALLPDELILEGILAPTLYDIFFMNSMDGWIVGDNGVVFRSTDGGNNWELLRIGRFPHLFSVFFRNEIEGWAAGQNGLLLQTQDGGISWKQIEISVDGNLNNILFSDRFGLIVGDRGVVVKTVDAGITWHALNLDLAPPQPFIADAWITTNSVPAQILLMGEKIIRINNDKILD